MERRPETFHLDQDRRADPELNRKTYATSQRRSTLALAWRARSIGTAPNCAQHQLLARKKTWTAGSGTWIGDDQVDPRLEVLGDTEVVERHSQQDCVRGEQLVNQDCSQCDGGLLLRRAIGFRYVRGADSARPSVGRQDVNADVSALYGVAGMDGKPFGFDDVGDLATGRALHADAGVQTEQCHVVSLDHTWMPHTSRLKSASITSGVKSNRDLELSVVIGCEDDRSAAPGGSGTCRARAKVVDHAGNRRLAGNCHHRHAVAPGSGRPTSA